MQAGAVMNTYIRGQICSCILRRSKGKKPRWSCQCVTCSRSTSQFCKYEVKAMAVYLIWHTGKVFIKVRGERRAHCMAESWLDSALFQGRPEFLLNSHSLCQPALSPNLHYSSQAWFTLFERSTTDFKASPEQPHYPSLVHCKHEGEKWSASFQEEHAKFYFSFPSWRLRISWEHSRSQRMLPHKQTSDRLLGTRLLDLMEV